MTAAPLMARGDRGPLVGIVVVAIVAWSTTLLAPEARYWDDWVASSDPIGLYHDLGLPWMGPIVQALFALGPWTFKLLGVVSAIVVGCMTYLVAGRGLSLSQVERWLVAALVVALPLNTARSALAVLLTYSLSMALFMIAWYLVVRRPPASPGRVRYLVAAVLFFISFSTASLLPFIAAPAAHLLFLGASESGWSWRTVRRLIARFWYLGAAPVVFWIVRTLCFQPTALYEDYNRFITLARPLSVATRGTLLLAVLAVVTVVVVIVWRRVAPGHPAASLGVVALGGLTGAVAVLMSRLGDARSLAWVAVTALLVACAVVLVAHGIRLLVRRGRGEAQRDAVVPIAATGLLLLLLGTLPYLVVDKVPTFADWEVRHQLLMPIGIAVIVVAAWRALGPRRGERAIAVGVVTAFALVSLWTTLTLVADWRKQAAVIEALRASDAVRGVSTVVFADGAQALNFGDRPYSTFDYHGWLGVAFGDRTRYGVDAAQVGAFLDADPEALEQLGSRYGYGGYQYSTEAVRVDIEQVPGASRFDLLVGSPAIEVVVTPIDDLEKLR
ncbi:MAG: hypothetical protein ABI566_12330 [Pseudolysinimonas sp.]